MNTPEINQQITFIYTDDLTKSAGFYESILGLKLWLDQGTCRIYSVTDTALLGICQTGNGAKGVIKQAEQNNVILTLIVPDVDGWYAYLKAQGIQFDHPPQHNPKYAIYHCFLRDPNGYLIEIQRFEN